MKSSVFVASLCLGVLASDAFAASVAIKGSLGETVNAGDNYFLSNTPSGTTLESLSTFNLDFLARTPDTRFLLNTNLGYYKYFGSGAVDTSPTSGTPAGATFRIDHTSELNKYDFVTSWHRADVATTQLRESGLVTGSGYIDTYKIGGGITRDVGRADTIGLSVQGTTVSFTDSNQTPYVDILTTGIWTHILSPTTTLINTVTFDWFDADDPAKTQRQFWQIMTGLRSQLSSRLTFNGSLGVGYANSYQNNVAQPIIPSGATTFQTGTTSSVIGNVGLTYQLLKSTSFSLTAGQSIVPTTVGQLQKISTVGFTLSHAINSSSNVSFSTQFAHNIMAGITSDLFSAQIGYGYQLSREWRTNLAYTYRQREDTTGSARSSFISLALVYDFTLMGNPTVFDVAEKERARERAQQAVGQAFPSFQ